MTIHLFKELLGLSPAVSSCDVYQVVCVVHAVIKLGRTSVEVGLVFQSCG